MTPIAPEGCQRGETRLLPEGRPMSDTLLGDLGRQRLVATNRLPAVLLADVVRDVDDATENDEGAFRRVNGSSNQVGMSKQAHAFLSGRLHRERIARRWCAGGWKKRGRDGSKRERHDAAKRPIPVQGQRLRAVAAAVTDKEEARLFLRGDVVMRASELVGGANDHVHPQGNSGTIRNRAVMACFVLRAFAADHSFVVDFQFCRSARH